MRETENKFFKPIIGAIMIIALFGSVLLLKPTPAIKIPSDLQQVLWPEPQPLTAFNLSMHNNQAFNLESLQNKWTLLFFGYTHCPDVCPLALTVMKAVYKSLAQYPKVQRNTQMVFVSVDPARDTPEHISQYVAHFDSSFIGVTGEVAQIDQLAKSLNAGYVSGKVDEFGRYDIDHTSSIYLIGPQRQVHGAFIPPHFPETISNQLLAVMKLREPGLRIASFSPN